LDGVSPARIASIPSSGAAIPPLAASDDGTRPWRSASILTEALRKLAPSTLTHYEEQFAALGTERERLREVLSQSWLLLEDSEALIVLQANPLSIILARAAGLPRGLIT